MTYKISKRIYEERMESGLLQSEVADKLTSSEVEASDFDIEKVKIFDEEFE